ncbi:MAG: diaminopimelate epimerase [Gammaproteobacteria bacterium]
MKIPFTKMHGLGNDFVMLDLVTNEAHLTPERILELGHRHFGIGFDQVLVVQPPSAPDVDFDYRIFNVDGEEVEHCGNGARCFANFVFEQGLTAKNPIRVKTINRILTLHRNANGEVSVDMGRPEFDPALIPFKTETQAPVYTRSVEIDGETLELTFSALSMGNPHAVLSVEDLDNSAVTKIGSALCGHPDFPAGVNVGFMQILSPSEIKLRVFERGAGETLACGTGACAAVVSGCLRGVLSDTVKVNLTGGQLQISWPQESASVTMTGPTATVFEGTIEL